MFRRTIKSPVPKSATVTEKNGKLTARWRSRGTWHTAPVVEADDGTRSVEVEVGTYYGRFKDHSGAWVTRATGCRDETNARQKLAKWEKEAGPITAGVLDGTARAAAGPLESHLDAHEQALTAADVSAGYKANALRAVRRLTTELGFKTVRDIRRDEIEGWLADAITEEMGTHPELHRDAIVRYKPQCGIRTSS